DTAYAADPWLDKEMYRDLIRRPGEERILFGSDYPWHLPSMEIRLINSLDIGEEEKKMILGENAAKLLGL
ncbi:MAG: amidohydrolase family protein, partial [Cloacibacillus sp.]|nr:amidohydrolase family protein [Cloacibacillus sp.]